jgi:multiple sugar transport system substrate-binding protein
MERNSSGRKQVIKTISKLAALSTALLSMGGAAIGQETVVWWDFLGGGDGVRMKALIDRFNEEHAGQIQIDATTLEWGIPFYTKVQTSAAIGEGPDIMTYHLSRLPAGVQTGSLAPIDPADLASVGLGPETFAQANWEAAQVDGQLYAVPFDIHAVVLYYNKDALGAAGLLNEDGTPNLGSNPEEFKASLQKLKDAGHEYGISIHTTAGDSQWRIFSSLLGQQDGVFLQDGQILPGDNLQKAINAASVVNDWVTSGLAPAQTDYAPSIALFTSKAAPLHINGVWEVPTFTDLAAKGELGFEWGATELPVLFNHPATWADSHAWAIPAGREMTPEKKTAVLQVIKWMAENSLAWADAGHIPAYSPARNAEELKTKQPYATYSILAENAEFDPSSTISGVGAPIYDAAGNYLMPAINGELDVTQAMTDMQADLQDQLE